MTSTLLWIVVYPSTLIFFFLLGIFSLEYYKIKSNVSADDFHQLIAEFKFPLSILKRTYQNESLRNYILPAIQTEFTIQANRFLWSSLILLFFVALFSTVTQGYLLLRMFWIVFYIIAFSVSWTLGKSMNQNQSA